MVSKESKETTTTEVSAESTTPSYTRVKITDGNEINSNSKSKESSRLDKAESKVTMRLARDLRLLSRIERRRRELVRKPEVASFAESLEVLDTLEKLVKKRAKMTVKEGDSLIDQNITITPSESWFGDLPHKFAEMFSCSAMPQPCRA